MYFPLFGGNVEAWVSIHLELMSISYLGIVTAAIAEIGIRAPLMSLVDSLGKYVLVIFMFLGLVGAICHYAVYRYKKHYHQGYQNQAMLRVIVKEYEGS